MSLGELPFARRNYNLLVGDVSLFLIAIAFLDTATVFPVLVERLGGNSALIGGVLTLRQALMFLPPIFVAHRLRGRTRYLSPLIRICVLGRLWLMVAGWVVLREGIAHQTLALIALIVAYLLLWLSDGMGLVPWMAIVGRSVPAERRGRLFATTTVVSAFAKRLIGILCAFGLRLEGGHATWVRQTRVHWMGGRHGFPVLWCGHHVSPRVPP